MAFYPACWTRATASLAVLIADTMASAATLAIRAITHFNSVRETVLPKRDLFAKATTGGTALPMGVLPAWHAARTPALPALTVGAHTIGYSELEQRANRRARALAALGVAGDDVVLLAARNDFAFYEFSFAVWKLGASVCHVSHTLPDAELAAIGALAQPKVVVASVKPEFASTAFLAADAPIDESLSADALPEAIARHWKISTSGGSTGRPKLIVDHGPSTWNPERAPLGMLPGDVTVNCAPLYHNAPFGLMHAALFTGGHVVELQRFDSERMLAAIARWRATWLYLVPTMMHRIIQLPGSVRLAYDMTSLEFVVHMAAACPVWLKEKWIEWLGPDAIWELYGGTETLGATVIGGREWLTHKGSVGRLWFGGGLKVFADDGAECATGVIGEIFFRVGDTANYHYIGADARRRGDWQSFGDLGYLDEDGYLYLADRRTDMIVSGGANVYPAEVEAAIDAYPGVNSSIVIGLPHADLGHRVHAIISVTDPDRGDAAGLMAFLATRLARYKIPRTFEFVEHPLRGDDGKARRSALREERL